MGAVVNVRGITDKKSFATKKAKCRRKKRAGAGEGPRSARVVDAGA